VGQPLISDSVCPKNLSVRAARDEVQPVGSPSSYRVLQHMLWPPAHCWLVRACGVLYSASAGPSWFYAPHIIGANKACLIPAADFPMVGGFDRIVFGALLGWVSNPALGTACRHDLARSCRARSPRPRLICGTFLRRRSRICQPDQIADETVRAWNFGPQIRLLSELAGFRGR